jgi:hypothetical protein
MKAIIAIAVGLYAISPNDGFSWVLSSDMLIKFKFRLYNSKNILWVSLYSLSG